jgi:hypothetical protein
MKEKEIRLPSDDPDGANTDDDHNETEHDIHNKVWRRRHDFSLTRLIRNMARKKRLTFGL